jgi:hypothetical protein
MADPLAGLVGEINDRMVPNPQLSNDMLKGTLDNLFCKEHRFGGWWAPS